MKRRSLKVLVLALMIVCLLFTQIAYAEEAAAEKDLEYLQSVMDMIKEKYRGQVTDQQLLEGALKGMFDSMDPYTTYFTAEEADSFISDISGNYEGVGIQMEKVGDTLVVAKVFSASPAERAGLLAGDKLVQVGDKNIVGAAPEEAAALIKGPGGTKVTIGVLREGVTGIKLIEVTRGKVTVNPVSYTIKNGIGYIKLDMFNSNASQFVNDALEAMDKQGIQKVILDLRNNPGGEVSQASAIAGKFVPKGLVTKLDFKSEAISDQMYYSDLPAIKYKLAVLVNENSASASEIVAGAIQDTKAGTLIGTKTFGKAKVQNMLPLLTPEAYKKYGEQLGKKVVDAYELMTVHNIYPSDDEIMGWTKITTGQYTTPKGRMIDLIGLTPDITVANYEMVKDIDINNVQSLALKVKPKLNSEGVDVYNAEKILKISGYDVDAPDMKLDAKTFNALKKFQKDSKLYPYGILDFGTQKALNKKLDALILTIDKQYAKALEILNK
jgi:carboxyl-terminal processing protease